MPAWESLTQWSRVTITKLLAEEGEQSEDKSKLVKPEKAAMTKQLETQGDQDDNCCRHNRDEYESTQNDSINHSLTIEIQRTFGTAARSRIDHIATITAGDKVHGSTS